MVDSKAVGKVELTVDLTDFVKVGKLVEMSADVMVDLLVHVTAGWLVVVWAVVKAVMKVDLTVALLAVD